MLRNKKILLGISGGIAAYKCASLVRLFVKAGAQVKVVMTPAAREFVTPQTLSVLSKNQVYTDFFDGNLIWNNHVQLAEWADYLVVAPLTANTLSKMAAGTCDNLLLAVYLSARSPVILAPAMDLEMVQHATVKTNLESLSKRGHLIVPTESGELASGLIGEGRMAEPETIFEAVNKLAADRMPLIGKRVLLNAGPTYEPIDSVRFVGNRSSGKMGMAIAENLAEKGAEVCLVLGPSQVEAKHPGIRVIAVETAEEMHGAMLKNYDGMDLVICSAAVADYRPSKPVKGKIKKKEEAFQLDLVKTRDILQDLGRSKEGQYLVGFALETEYLIENAKGKLQNKNLDLVVANLSDSDNQAFQSDKNAVVFIEPDNKITEIGLKSKVQIAEDLVQFLISRLKK